MKILTIVATLLLPVAFASAADPLADNFRTPPPETRPWCYWYWISDNISKDGITPRPRGDGPNRHRPGIHRQRR
jgi:hypothetical protein